MHGGGASGQFQGPGADVALHRRLLAVPVANAVHIYSLDSSTLATVLRGHQKPVTAARFSGDGDSQLLTASADGTLCTWDVEKGTLIRSVAAGQPITGLAVPSGGDVAHLSVAWNDRGAGRASAELVATHDNRRVLVWPAAGPGAAPLALHHTKAFQCVAVSPCNDRVAAGDATGRILIWHGVGPAVAAAAAGDDGKQQSPQDATAAAASAPAAAAAVAVSVPQPVVTSVHWHAHAVRALAFSLDAQRLLSGGDEAVLVTWRLADNSRSFLAHLGAPLTAVLPADAADAAYVVARSDNALCQVSTATGGATEIAAGAVPSPEGVGPSGESPPPPVGVPEAGSGGARVLALAGAGAVLQLYDAAAGRAVARLQVGQQAPAVVGGRQGPGAALQHVAFSADGTLLVTVDVRQDAGTSGTTTYLRFWRSAASGVGSVSTASAPSYVLQTAVEAPHGNSKVAGLALHPTQLLAATSGGDGVVQLWAPALVKGGTAAASAWHCKAKWSHRGSAAGRLAFSGDGSLLAAATPGSVALWDVAAGALAAALPHPPAAPGMATHLAFEAAGPMLVAAIPEGSSGTHRLVAWDLLTLGVAWSAALPLAALAAEPAGDGGCSGGGSLVVAVSGGAGSGWRDAVLRLDCRTGAVSAAWRAAAPIVHLATAGGGPRQALLAVTADRAHEAVPAPYMAEQPPALANAASPPLLAPEQMQPRPNPLEAAFGALAVETPTLEQPRPPMRDHAAIAEAVGKRLFDAPSHLLRPAPELAREFLRGLLRGG